MRIHLVPPSLTVLGRIISKRIPLTEHFVSLRDWMSRIWTLDTCEKEGFPRLRFATRGIGGGLAVGCTEDDSGILLWIFEVSCHNLCAMADERNCTHLLDILERIKKLQKRHVDYLTILPGPGRLYPSGNFAQKKGTP